MRICDCTTKNITPGERLRCQTCAGWTPYGRPLTNDKISRLAEETISILAKLLDDHQWLQGIIHSPTRQGDPIAIKQTGHSDPTGQTTTDPQRLRIRNYVVLCGRLLEHINETARHADEAAGDAFLAAETRPPGGDPHVPAAYHDTIPQGRPDLEQAHHARDRRHTRGEGIPT